MLRSGVTPLRSDLTVLTHDQTRDATHDWRAWYKTKRWRQMRWAVLVRAAFQCQACGRVEGDTSKLVADHIEPHRGDARLFWDAGKNFSIVDTKRGNIFVLAGTVILTAIAWFAAFTPAAFR